MRYSKITLYGDTLYDLEISIHFSFKNFMGRDKHLPVENLRMQGVDGLINLNCLPQYISGFIP